MEVVMYTKNGCHLCDDAKKLLAEMQSEFPFQLIERDIYKNDEWLEKYHLAIPVVEMDGEEVEYGKITGIPLRKRLLLKIGNT
ncbi:glutaredoxin family protein [Priestia aryabhattai]|uniref:glutaredoxin family protein n=1 Tax=Priestia aryabhattai TaxID=412384 RepID=UPI0039835A05